MYGTILVPVDGSDQSKRALKTAIEMAKTFGAQLLTLCVYRHHSPLEASLSMVKPKLLERPDDALKVYASDIAGDARDEAIREGLGDARAYAKRGQPSRAIVEFAEDHKADLIVLGARGTGDIGGYLLGSVSYKVTSLASIPCLVVR
ncbi:universal stress protein [Fulvimarina sp. MAC8]|uniref:universal stress protein n=1 Tax=Fulvimarina sp. MAC8 TaxID=3162874 RepID=UPI0032EC8A95